MTVTATVTLPAYLAAAKEARTLRKAIAVYSKPMDAEVAAMVLAKDGQEGLDTLVAACATYLAEQKDMLAEVTVVTDAWEAKACTRCSGTGDYQAPTSHMSKGRPICFQCKGTGQRR